MSQGVRSGLGIKPKPTNPPSSGVFCRPADGEAKADAFGGLGIFLLLEILRRILARVKNGNFVVRKIRFH